MSGPLQLVVEAAGEQQPGVRLLHQPFALIGRDQRADVPLEHRLVSRRHVYLQVVEGHVFWIDLESRLGTVGGARPRKFGWLADDETMKIGPYEIRRLISDGQNQRNALFPDATPLVAKSYGSDPWPEVALEFLNGPSRSAVWPMNRVMSLIGSAVGCKFRLADPSVSPFHCSLVRTSVGVWIVDLLGGDGVAVNNAFVRSTLLADGDVLKIGRYQIRIRSRIQDSQSYSTLSAEAKAPAQLSTSHTLSLTEASSLRVVPAPGPLGLLAGLGQRGWSGTAALTPMEPGPDVSRAELMPVDAFMSAGVERGQVSESVLVPLVNQFGMMQQQMLDQFQNAMGMLVEMFGSLQREQMDLIRQELDQLREVTREFQELKLELAAYSRDRGQADAVVTPEAVPEPSSPKASVFAPEPVAKVDPPSASASRGRSSMASTAASSSVEPASAQVRKKEVRPDDGDVMLWLNQRIATLQEERESRWQKILKLLPALLKVVPAFESESALDPRGCQGRTT